MNIDDFWLDDNDLSGLSRQVPSTKIGEQLMRRWKERFLDLQPSDFYRGYAIVLSTLCKHMRSGNTISAIDQIIDRIHDSRMASKTFPPGTDLTAGAVLAAGNAWEGAHSGVTADQVAAAYESEPDLRSNNVPHRPPE